MNIYIASEHVHLHVHEKEHEHGHEHEQKHEYVHVHLRITGHYMYGYRISELGRYHVKVRNYCTCSSTSP